MKLSIYITIFVLLRHTSSTFDTEERLRLNFPGQRHLFHWKRQKQMNILGNDRRFNPRGFDNYTSRRRKQYKTAPRKIQTRDKNEFIQPIGKTFNTGQESIESDTKEQYLQLPNTREPDKFYNQKLESGYGDYDLKSEGEATLKTNFAKIEKEKQKPGGINIYKLREAGKGFHREMDEDGTKIVQKQRKWFKNHGKIFKEDLKKQPVLKKLFENHQKTTKKPLGDEDLVVVFKKRKLSPDLEESLIEENDHYSNPKKMSSVTIPKENITPDQRIQNSDIEPKAAFQNFNEKSALNTPIPKIEFLPKGFGNDARHMNLDKVLPTRLHERDDTAVADFMFKKIRVLCWVLTYPANHNITLEAITKTWGMRCNKLMFMSTKYEPGYPIVKLNVPEGRDFLWPKVKAAYKYIFRYHRHEFEWFLRADDDTYIVMENLRYMLAGYDPKEPLYFGCRYKPFTSQGYMSGGAGIVLSQNALMRLARGLGRSQSCERNFNDNENDDINLGICLNRVGVKAMDTRDSLQRGRFLPFMPQDIVSNTLKSNFWYWSYVYYPTRKDMSCCSDYTISFHYISPEDMYALEFLVYRLRPYGIKFGSALLPDLYTKKIVSLTSTIKTITQGKTVYNNEIYNEVTNDQLEAIHFKDSLANTKEKYTEDTYEADTIASTETSVDPLDVIPTRERGPKTGHLWFIDMSCCSDYTISFHYISPEDMYALEFLIYRLRPYGIKFGSALLPDLYTKKIVSLTSTIKTLTQAKTVYNNEIYDEVTDDQLEAIDFKDSLPNTKEKYTEDIYEADSKQASTETSVDPLDVIPTTGRGPKAGHLMYIVNKTFLF